MAKAPQRDRFILHAETSAEELGPLLAQLTKMGLQNISYELITDVRTFGKNVPRNDMSGNEFAALFAKDNTSFSTSDLVSHFAEAGRSDGSAYQSLKTLVSAGLVTKIGTSKYQRSDVKALPAPQSVLALPAPKKRKKQKVEKLRRKGNSVARYETPNRDMMLRAIRGRATFTVQDLQNHFTKIDRNPKSVSPIITKFIGEKLVKMISPGKYQVLAKAKTAAISQKLKKKFKPAVAEQEALPPQVSGPAGSSEVVNG